MRTKGMVALILIACLSVVIAFGFVSDDSDAQTYGSDEVGAHKVTFDTNGGSGGYTQYILNGQEIYLPTERAPTGTSADYYSRITKDGCTLVGWNDHNGTHRPGEKVVITRDTEFRAVWQTHATLDGKAIIDVGDSEPSSLNNVGTVWSRDLFGSGIDVRLMVSEKDDNGSFETSGTTKEGGTTLKIGDVSVTLSFVATGNSENRAPNNLVGMWYYEYDIDVEVKFHNSKVGIYDVILTIEGNDSLMFSYSVVDPTYDPSNIRHLYVDKGEGSKLYASGPYRTAVKLPGSISNIQDGWQFTTSDYLNGIVAPIGSGIPLLDKETEVSAHTVSYDTALNLIAVIVYNANGGICSVSNTKPLATVCQQDGYTRLNGVDVSKDGHVLIGWNPSGSASDPLYPISPSGYDYYVEDDGSDGWQYVELRAVWVESASVVTVRFNAEDSTQNKTYTVYSGYEYYFPMHGFTHSSDGDEYDFKGWSLTECDPGEGIAIPETMFVVSEDTTYYAVFQKREYTYIVHYDNNRGEGTMLDSEETTTERPYNMVLRPCTFLRNGYNFIGWAETPTSDSPTVVGDTYLFSGGSQIVTLYAVWSSEPSSTVNRVVAIQFNGNGNDVTSVPSYIHSESGQDVSSYSMRIPTDTPMRAHYQFLGWSTTVSATHGQHIFHPGDSVTVSFEDGTWTLGEGYATMSGHLLDRSVVFVLYAVWTSPTGVDGSMCTVTFMDGSSVIRSIQVHKGKTVSPPNIQPKDGCCVRGWVSEGKVWDFSAIVMEDMTLRVQTFRIFTVSVDGNEVTVTLDDSIVSKETNVSFTDGHTETIAKRCVHEVSGNGTVTVTVLLDGRTFTASSPYVLSDNHDDDSTIMVPNDSTVDQIVNKILDTMYNLDPQIMGVIVVIAGILAFLVVTRRI